MNGFRRAAGRTWGWVRATDAFVLAAVGALAVGVWVFLVVADRVAGGTTHQADEWVIRSLREPHDPADPVGPPWVEEAARDVTALGGGTVLTLLVAAVVGYLVAGRHTSAAVLVLVAVVGGAVLSSILKDVFARPRPDFVPHLTRVTSASFPSGHAMVSAVTNLTLGALLARLVRPRWAKVYFVAVAAILTALVGISRVYLGVHYPTDVIAGWAAGVAWAVGCWLVARHLQNRDAVDRDAD